MLKGILSISGQGGLFKIVAESKNHVIVESLITKKRIPTFSTTKISSLEDIMIFTDSNEVPLKDVFKNIFEYLEGGPALDAKSDNQKIKQFFEKILPDYDRERVYISDMKKVLLWYNILHENNMLKFEEEDDNKEGEQEEPKKEGEKSES